MHPGYDGHASSVTLVETEGGEYIVRSSSIAQLDNEFWWGNNLLFGIDPRNVYKLESIHNMLRSTSVIPVPRVLHKGFINNKEVVVVEKLAGETICDFKELSCEALYSFGEGLAHIHRKTFSYIGDVQGDFQQPLDTFHEHMCTVMRKLVAHFYRDDREIASYLPELERIAKGLLSPVASNLILVDMDPTQFLLMGNQISGLVDTEAYAIAPRELDFVALEYLLDERSARAFQEGYSSILELPNLSQVRAVYRYLYRLLRVQGRVPIQQWMNHPTYFT
nr:hypothetical protein [Priestia taiwanensis]